jgi:hypothetical protein
MNTPIALQRAKLFVAEGYRHLIGNLQDGKTFLEKELAVKPGDIEILETITWFTQQIEHVLALQKNKSFLGSTSTQHIEGS